MARSTRVLLGLAATLALAATARAQATLGAGPLGSVPYIEVVADGAVRLVPDRATVSVVVETRASTAGAATAADWQFVAR